MLPPATEAGRTALAYKNKKSVGVLVSNVRPKVYKVHCVIHVEMKNNKQNKQTRKTGKNKLI